MVVCRVRPLN
jgi:kinesin family member 5